MSDPSGPPLPGLPTDLEAATFEELVEALEALTDRMASGELGIEAAADLYEQAQALHAAATERLRRVEARIDGLGTPPS